MYSLLRFTSWLFLFHLALTSPSLRAEIFPLEVGLKGLSSDRLEIIEGTSDSFVNPLISSRIGQSSSYLVNFPKSGIYTYRLLSNGLEVERDRVAVLLEAPPSGQFVELRWQPVAGEGVIYRLSFNGVKNAKTVVQTGVPLAYFKGRGIPWLVRIRSSQGVINQPVEGLSMAMTKPRDPPKTEEEPKAKAAPPPAEIHLDPFAPDDDQLLAEPDYKELLKGPEKRWWDLSGVLEGSGSRGRTTLAPLSRKNTLSLWLRTFREDFEVNKRDRYASAPTQGFGTGFAAHYYLQPTFQLQLEGDTHATETTYDEGGTEPPAAIQKRMRFLLGFLFDVANLETRHEDYSIDVGTNLALVQVPLTVDNQMLPDLGIQFGYQYFPWGFQSVFRAYKSESYEASVGWSLPLELKLMGPKLSAKPLLGLYTRQTKARDGAINALFREQGLRLGVELKF